MDASTNLTGSAPSPSPKATLPAKDELVRLNQVERIYKMGDNIVRALDGVNLSIHRGQYWSIIGRSGSGKSTLLNVLGCLDRPTGGSYFLGGTNVNSLGDDALSEIRGQRIGFIFQSFNLIPQLTVLENLEVPLFYQEHDPGVAKERAERYADRVGLKDRLHHRPNELSGGQQQRVAIARALMNEPLILLADEATGNLDSKTEKEILTLLDELHQEGMTVIMVTHSDKVADRAGHKLELRDGKVLQVTHHDKEDL